MSRSLEVVVVNSVVTVRSVVNTVVKEGQGVAEDFLYARDGDGGTVDVVGTPGGVERDDEHAVVHAAAQKQPTCVTGTKAGVTLRHESIKGESRRSSSRSQRRDCRFVVGAFAVLGEVEFAGAVTCNVHIKRAECVTVGDVCSLLCQDSFPSLCRP